PVPPMLEAAFGYAGQARYVGFYWESAGDELAYDDGRCGLAGAEWDAWLLFTRHHLVAPVLAAYDLGNSDAPARHWLILDRQTRTLAVAPVQEARTVVRQQWPPISARSLMAEEWEAIKEELHRRAREQATRPPAVFQAEMVARMAAH